jgi:hypothetical protein
MAASTIFRRRLPGVELGLMQFAGRGFPQFPQALRQSAVRQYDTILRASPPSRPGILSYR